MEEITVKDILNGKDGVIKMNFTKIKEKIRQCKEDKINQECRRELEGIGVTWVD